MPSCCWVLCKAIWDSVIERLENSIGGWKRGYLSKGMRLVQIKGAFAQKPNIGIRRFFLYQVFFFLADCFAFHFTYVGLSLFSGLRKQSFISQKKKMLQQEMK